MLRSNPHQTSTTWAPSPRWLLNRNGVIQRIRRFLPAHNQKIAQTNCEKLKPILHFSSFAFQRLRVKIGLLHDSPFHSLLLAIVRVSAVSPDIFAQLRHFVLSRSTHVVRTTDTKTPNHLQKFRDDLVGLATQMLWIVWYSSVQPSDFVKTLCELHKCQCVSTVQWPNTECIVDQVHAVRNFWGYFSWRPMNLLKLNFSSPVMYRLKTFRDGTDLVEANGDWIQNANLLPWALFKCGPIHCILVHFPLRSATYYSRLFNVVVCISLCLFRS